MWGFNNSKSRTRLDLNGSNTTIRFKLLFKNFTIWKDKLKSYGVIDESQIIESDYNNLIGMIGNSYLKFTTDVKNYSYIAQEFMRLYAKRVRRQKLYDIEIYKLNDNVIKSEGKAYLGDNDLNGDFNENYANSKTLGDQTTKLNISDRINNMGKIIELENPAILFIRELGASIVKPYQDNDYGEVV